MPKPVISVENLSKAYRIGVKDEIPDTLVGAMTSVIRSPFKNLQRLRRLDTFTGGPNGNESDDTLWALKDVSFDVQEGEVVGIIGRNGAGKSTLLKVLSRITDPTSGRVVIRGRVSSLLEVGTGFHPELTGRDNIYLNGTILGMTKREIDRKFDEIVDFSGVEKFLDTPVKRYSSGMQVRLAFAVAAHLEPEILIIDEVLAVGDVGFQTKCLGKMQDVARDGRTVLFVSHNMAAVESLCMRAVLVASGKIEDDNDSKGVINSYNNSFQHQSFDSHTGDHIAGDPGRGDDYFLRFSETPRIFKIACGEPLEVKFNVEAPKQLKELFVGVTFSAPSGEPILSTSSKVQNVKSEVGFNNNWTVSIDFGCLPLNAASYHAKVYISDGVMDVALFSDAFQLEILPRDVYGWGNALPPVKSWGYCFWASDWSISPQPRGK
ncbi:polysaccharide ABC transporter ATP-binding protein [Thalassoglobus sp.]|uniref:ABC transporter ATP-binding protein n=1 Tax=Thalassoglobus sp. TaxID=2795869 RepID=UPI003AA8ABC7